MTVDPLSLQVFANLFSAIAEEMGVTLQQAAYSPNITMRRDYSCAIFDPTGNLLAQAAHIPVHLGAMPVLMRAIRRNFELQPGDVVITNDPYQGGTHLPDVSLVSASFAGDGTLLGYVMSRAHHADIGGMSPGSMPLSTEIYQEGMIIPPLLLVERGVLNDSLLALILRNVRTSDERRGDLAAQRAAQRAGEEGLRKLAVRYGADTIAAHGQALQAYSEVAMRRTIERIPTGRYAFTDALDDDGQSESTVAIGVEISRAAGSTDLTIDFSSSAPQCRGSVNAVAAVTISATLYVMRCLQGDDVPVNEGSLRPLHVIAPAATVVAAIAPAPVAGGNVETSQRIVDVLFGALAIALPGEIPAASQGTMNNLAMGGFDETRGRAFAYYETMGGGAGARPGQDGASGIHDHMSNTLNTPIEVLESEYPLRIATYRLRASSGGRGEFHGGEGIERVLQFLHPATVTILSERRVLAPYGLGGGPGSTGENMLSRAGVSRQLAGKTTVRAESGDILTIRSPGGGGLTLPESEGR